MGTQIATDIGTELRKLESQQNRMKLDIELVPTPLWRESLYRLLTSGQWDKIRKPALDRAAGRCEVCNDATARLLSHEQWQYDDATGVRKLTGVRAVCGPCSSVMHIGRAGKVAAQGELSLDNVYFHFMRVNSIDWPTAQKAIDAAFAIHGQRSQQEWTTDFGPYQSVVDERRAQFPDGRIPVKK